MSAKLSSAVIFLMGGAVLAGMMVTTPDYNSVFQPFKIHASTGTVADGRLFDARFLGGRLVRNIAFKRLGKEVNRNSSGVFLIVDFEVLGVVASSQIAAKWKGNSARLYEASPRFDYAPNIIQERTFQPGLNDKSFAVFELPEDEVAGGQLILSTRGITDLDGALYLDTARILPAIDFVRL